MSTPFPANSRRRIRTLAQLYQAAGESRSVVVSARGDMRQPAAWIMSEQAGRVHRLIESGMYLYVSKKKPKPKAINPRILLSKMRVT